MLVYNCVLISAHLQSYCCMSSTVLSVTHGKEDLEHMVPIPDFKLSLFEKSIVSGMKSIVSFYYMIYVVYIYIRNNTFISGCHTKKIHPDSRTVYVEQRRPEKVRVVIGMCGKKISTRFA